MVENFHQLNWVADVCRQQQLQEKWLLSPRLRIGHQWKEWINRSLAQSTINLHVKTLPGVVRSAVAGELGSQRIASAQLCDLILQDILHDCAEHLTYLARLESLDGVCDVIGRSVADLRNAGLSAESIQSHCFDDPHKADDIRLVLETYESRLSDNELLDYADCLRHLKSRVDQGEHQFGDVRMLLVQQNDRFSELEDSLIQSLAAQSVLLRPDGPPQPTDFRAARDAIGKEPGRLRVAVAMGEANEIHAAMGRIAAADQTLDQTHLLHTDYETYVPQILEYFAAVDRDGNDIDQLPVTFSEGIACIYSRPGRALRSWLRWVQHDCPQSRLVQMLREGVVEVGGENVVHGHARLASQLRKLPIGFGQARYLEQLVAAIAQAEKRIELAASDPDRGNENTETDYGLSVLQSLHGFMSQLVGITPALQDHDPLHWLAAAEAFLNQIARKANKLDRYAVSAMLDQIAGLRHRLQLAKGTQFDLRSWLHELPLECRVLQSGPAPGCLHVDHVSSGGHTGRRSLVIVGMDDSRFPIRSRQDPFLLDEERSKLNASLSTSDSRNTRQQDDFLQMIASHTGDFTFIHSQISLASDSGLFPSSFLLEVFRELTGNDQATLEDLHLAAGDPVCFVGRQVPELTKTQSQLLSLLSLQETEARQQRLESNYPIWRDSQIAVEAIADPTTFTAFDGFVPVAGKQLDPTDEQNGSRQPVSASSLESFAACPRRYFFQRGLKIYPPDELVLSADQWLDPLQLGALAHSVFEKFLVRLTQQDLTPNYSRDWEGLNLILQAELADLEKVVPVLQRDVANRQAKDLEKMCEIFLREEQLYCEATGARPYVMEAAIGTGMEPSEVQPLDHAEPLALTLPDGRTCLVRGVIDRVDRLEGSDENIFSIWDYKTGSDWGFTPTDPTGKGRKLQPFLYAGMLQHRLREIGEGDSKVRYFGYFFPSSKANGVRMQWSIEELKATGDLLLKLFNLIKEGCFVASDNAADCRFCDYQEICGDAARTETQTKLLLQSAELPVLKTFRDLRQT